MEPSSVFRNLWRQRWFAIPALALTLAAGVLVFAYGPREYEATASYALVDPRVPTDAQIEQDPTLKQLNSDNPYLRSTDPNLIANVLITQLNSPARQESMKARGLSGDYLASPGVGGAGLIVSIAVTGSTPRLTLATTEELGRILVSNLRTAQKINGADDRYLYTALIVDRPDRAIEKLSSRLRTVIIVGIAGIILMFGAVSLGTALETGRRRRREEHAEMVESEKSEDEGAGSLPATTPVAAEKPTAQAPPSGAERSRPAARATRAAGSKRTPPPRSGRPRSGDDGEGQAADAAMDPA